MVWTGLNWNLSLGSFCLSVCRAWAVRSEQCVMWRDLMSYQAVIHSPVMMEFSPSISASQLSHYHSVSISIHSISDCVDLSADLRPVSSLWKCKRQQTQDTDLRPGTAVWRTTNFYKSVQDEVFVILLRIMKKVLFWYINDCVNNK